MVMKKNVLLLCVGLSFFGLTKLKAQTSVVERITTRMKDSLGLNETQHAKILAINQQIFTEKGMLRTKYAGTDSLIIVMQKAEMKRDSLLLPVLTEKQLMLYNEKRPRLVNAN
jgi:hypothetical protein